MILALDIKLNAACGVHKRHLFKKYHQIKILGYTLTTKFIKNIIMIRNWECHCQYKSIIKI